MQLNPARGRKHRYNREKSRTKHGFMQLNPARGRKLVDLRPEILEIADVVYAAQPREGTETYCLLA